MRVSPRELKAVRAGGLVSRYAMLGDAAFVVADLPDGGTAGTSVEEPCRLEHWGLVLQGDLTLLGSAGTHVRARDGVLRPARPRAPVPRLVAGRRRRLRAGHRADRRVARGAPGAWDRGAVPRGAAPASSRHDARRRDAGAARSALGQIETETAVMGDWLFRRSTFGPQSGYAEPWCDLPHWGFVLDGNMVLHWESQDLELLGPGDVYHCPGGPPGHRMEVADSALVVDYTPMSALDDARVRRAARTVRAYVHVGDTTGGERRERRGRGGRRGRPRPADRSSQGRRAGLLTSRRVERPQDRCKPIGPGAGPPATARPRCSRGRLHLPRRIARG